MLQEVFATHILVPNDRVSQENDQVRPLCPFPYFSRSPKGDYPGGTLHSGTQNNSPDDPGSIGEWRSRATLLANWNDNTNLFDGSPIAFATMLYSLNNGRDSLVSEGLVLNVGLSVKRAVIGGTGSFAAASGEVRHQNLGTNATTCFNYRFTFKLSERE